jgi:hypothetical protein
MSLDAGDEACSHGLSKRIFDAYVAYGPAFANPPFEESMKKFASIIATAVVAEVLNASVTVTVNPLGLTCPSGAVVGTCTGTGTVG